MTNDKTTRSADLVHKVAKGDTLMAIAKKHGVPMEVLMKLNKIDNPHFLWVGQRLKIPKSEEN